MFHLFRGSDIPSPSHREQTDFSLLTMAQICAQRREHPKGAFSNHEKRIGRELKSALCDLGQIWGMAFCTYWECLCVFTLENFSTWCPKQHIHIWQMKASILDNKSLRFYSPRSYKMWSEQRPVTIPPLPLSTFQSPSRTTVFPGTRCHVLAKQNDENCFLPICKEVPSRNSKKSTKNSKFLSVIS